MKNILILGAGRSSSSLIEYLLKAAAEYNYTVTVADTVVEAARQKIRENPRARGISLNTNDKAATHQQIEEANLVISMLPAFLHPVIAAQCVELKKHLVTASYVSPEMEKLDEEAKKA